VKKMKRCRSKFDPQGVAIPCVRWSGHAPRHRSEASSNWVDPSSEEPIPYLRGTFRMEWNRPRRESPTFVKVKR
jgi:hypothetical protein